MTLHIETGHPVTNDNKPVDGKFVRFVNEDGRCLFEVGVYSNSAIEVRGVEVIKAGGKIFSEILSVIPRSGNSLLVQAREYPNDH